MKADWTYWESNWVETRAREMDHQKALRMAPMRARWLDWWRRTDAVKAPKMARQILMGSNLVQMMAHWTDCEANLAMMMALQILKDSMMAPMKAR